jgi:Ca2+-transporting ATPase
VTNEQSYSRQPADPTPWHSLEATHVAEMLATDSSRGLTQVEAELRFGRDGANRLDGGTRVSIGRLVLEQLANPLVYLLVGSAIVSALAGKSFDAAVIALIVVANTLIGVVQESRAENALEALRKLSSPRARVVRDGDVRIVEAETVVVGDLLVLETGDRVSADARILTATELRVDESALTGESDAVDKSPAALVSDTPLAERASLVFSSTPVVAGRATALVVATGMHTVVGQIAGEVQAADRQESPLQARLAKLSARIGVAAVLAALIIFGLGVLRGESLAEMLLFSVAAAVSAIPEGLPTAVSVSLALGVQRMAKRKAIIRRLPAVETLGSCTVICTDKTGTLTKNEMTVTHLWVLGHTFGVTGAGFDPEGTISALDGSQPIALVRPLLDVGCIANNALLEQDEVGRWRVEGNPTEGALLAVAHKAGISPVQTRCDVNRIHEIPFSSQTKYMATLDGFGDGRRLHVKGAAERILGFCDRILLGGEIVPLDDGLRSTVRQAADSLADQALRVVAGAFRDVDDGAVEVDRSQVESGLVLAGLWGLLDPPRDEARTAVAAAKRAGISVKMITGDHATTAAAIAREVGILPQGAVAGVITGSELDRLDEEQLNQQVRALSVFARVEPRHKIRIVAALQSLGEVVSMTGDGVNDAPALKRADIGVAMGITGTEVSKEAADMVLADDDFATIVSAVEEGRVIYGNLRRVVAFLLTVALGEVLAIGASQLVGWPLPVSAVMILWVNLVVASTCTIPLGVEPKHEDVLALPPRSPSQGIIEGHARTRILVGASVTAVGVLAVFGYYLGRAPLIHAQTMAFMTIVAFEWGQALTARSWRVPLARLGVTSNRSLVFGLALGFALQLLAVSSPLAERLLGTDPVGPKEWALTMAVGLTSVVVGDVMTRLHTRSD